GFLLINLAIGLKTNLFDPDRRADGVRKPYKHVRLGLDAWELPAFGNGLLGDDVEKADGSDALTIVAANGGSDLIYVPGGGSDTVRRIVALLLSYDYVGGSFVDEERYGKLPGALSLGEIGLRGSSGLPRPAIAVAFKVFCLNSAGAARHIGDSPPSRSRTPDCRKARACTADSAATARTTTWRRS